MPCSVGHAVGWPQTLVSIGPLCLKAKYAFCLLVNFGLVGKKCKGEHVTDVLRDLGSRAKHKLNRHTRSLKRIFKNLCSFFSPYPSWRFKETSRRKFLQCSVVRVSSHV